MQVANFFVNFVKPPIEEVTTVFTRVCSPSTKINIEISIASYAFSTVIGKTSGPGCSKLRLS